jgi:hypothetical protein
LKPATVTSELPGEKIPGGAAWVDRFLRPLLAQHFPPGRSLACLQVSPEDPSEAIRLRELGHRCEMTEPGARHTLAMAEGSCDFVFTGRFAQRAPDRAARLTLAREFFRVLREGGALLVLVGNRWCPLDLSRNGPLLHGPWTRTALSYGQCVALFVGEAGFAAARPLGLSGHFGWASLPRVLRPLGWLLDRHWQWLATPDRRWLYAGPLNPALLLWLTKR